MVQHILFQMWRHVFPTRAETVWTLTERFVFMLDSIAYSKKKIEKDVFQSLEDHSRTKLSCSLYFLFVEK